MNRKTIKNWIGTAFFGAVLAGELAVLVDVVLVFNGIALSVVKFAALVALLFFLQFLLPRFRLRHRKWAACILALVVGLPLLVGFLCWFSVSRSVVYRDVDDGKAGLYEGHRVMLLVPHQDDDINVLGGVMEEYIRYGSEVYVVFSTNGDYYDLAEVRFREAVNALENVGIQEDHVIFLGYGDQWAPEGPHIYNASPDEVLHSRLGRTETYGMPWHAAYREGQAYTIDNFLSDIENVILEYRPDMLYCVDYDYNIDHRALSHSFEKVMGRILKEHPDYRPQIFKGYAYNTAWEAENDFYRENLLSAQDIFAQPYLQQPAVYRWEDRVRLPVSAAGLSRSVLSAGLNETLSMYASQGANMYGPRVINGDKVFWQRNTGSVLHDARITVSSGRGDVLNDFMLLDSINLLDGERLPADGTWIPEPADGEKRIDVKLSRPGTIREIVLYDHPGAQENVLNARISFDDGSSLETGPLDPMGSATRIPVGEKKVSSFAVTLLETQGEAAGLTEMEAYPEEQTMAPAFVKLMDEEENFAYDYWIDPSGVQRFRLYSSGGQIKPEDCMVSCSNPACSAVAEENGILVRCPAGEECVVTVTAADGNLEDSVYIRNPGRLERMWKMFWLRAEEKVMRLCETRRLHERIFVCRLYTKAAAKLAGILG